MTYDTAADVIADEYAASRLPVKEEHSRNSRARYSALIAKLMEGIFEDLLWKVKRDLASATQKTARAAFPCHVISWRVEFLISHGH